MSNKIKNPHINAVSNDKKTIHPSKGKTLLPSMTLYVKSFGCAGPIRFATVKMWVIFKIFNSALFEAAAIEPKKRP